MNLFRRKKPEAVVEETPIGLPLLTALEMQFTLGFSESRLKEACLATPGEHLASRVLHASETIGLVATPTKYEAALDSAHMPILVEGHFGAAIVGLDANNQPIYLATVGGDIPDIASLKPLRAWIFAKADSQTGTVEYRLSTINPMKNIGTIRLAWVLLAALLSNILGLATSLFVMVVYDRVLPNQATESLYALAFGVAMAVLFDTMLKSAKGQILENASRAADRRVTEDIFDQFVEARPTTTGKSVGQLASVIRSFETYREFMTSAMILSFVDLPFVALFIFVIAQISGLLWIVPAIAVPTVLILVVLVQPLVARSSRQATEVAQTRQSLLIETLSGLDHLRVSGAYGLLKRRFLNQAIQQTDATNRAKKSASIVGTVISILQQVFQVAVIVLGFHLFVTDQVSMGGIIAAVILFGRVMSPLSRLGQTLGRANHALSAYRVVRDFLALERNSDSPLPVQLDNQNAAVLELSNVTMRLSENAPPLLNGVNLRIEPGQKVAIVGRTGAGKTSILRLFSGLLRAESGNVLCNGIAVGAYPRADFHRRVGTVFQTPWLFSGTLRDNLGLGQIGITDEKMLHALKLAGLISGQGDGFSLDMMIAEQGANLSGGQRQAVNIARAFASDPDIFLLDEPSSAMDSQLEANLVHQMKTGLADKTFVLVTHKAKLLELCDRIVVVDKGQLKGDMPAKDYFDLRRKKAGARSASATRSISPPPAAGNLQGAKS